MADKCKNCGATDPEESLYLSNPLTGDYGGEYWCEPCAIRLWPTNVHFVFGYGIPDEVKKRLLTLDMIKRLRNWDVPFKALPVYFFHRRESESTKWISMWDQRAQYSKPGAPYGYRAWCSYDHIMMLYDETETPDSVEWVFYHELAHAVCNRARMFDQAMERENRIEGRTYYEWRDDAGHEADSEERLVNRIATAHMDGRERARAWWRPRVTAKQRGYTVLPDAFAPDDSPEFIMFAFAKMEGWASPLPIIGFDESRIEPQFKKLGITKTFGTEPCRQKPDFAQRLKDLIPQESNASEPQAPV